MNFTCNQCYKAPSLQSSTYNNGTLLINNVSFKSVYSSLHLNHKKSSYNVISSNGKHNSYERYLLKKKYSM